MLGVARNAQLAGWGTVPPQAIINGTGKLGYEVYQNPSFGYQIGVDSRPQWELETTATAAITNAAVTDNKGFVLATTFRMEWDPETVDPPDENTVYGFLHQVNVKTADFSGFNSINVFLQLREGRLNVTSRFETDTTTRRVTKDLPGSWQDYNNRWMTIIFASSSFPDTYANYAPVNMSGTPVSGQLGQWNCRSTLFDTETAEMIQNIDFIPSLPNALDFPLLAGWPMESGEFLPVPFNTSGTNGFYVVGSIDVFLEPAPQPYRLANLWGSLGRGFDPIAAANQLTTVRPSSVINDVSAWYNIQFADYVAGSGSTPYYIAPSGADFMVSGTNGRAFDLTFGNNATEFNAGYSNTIKPKDRNI